MPETHHSLFSLTAALIVGYASLTTSVIAQEAPDLTEENIHLKNQVQLLSKELKAAQARLAILEKQIEQLKLALNQSSGNGPDASSPTAPTTQEMDSAKPEDNPHALFRALEKDYAEATQDLEIGERGDRKRAAYLRVIERWIASSNRKYKSKIEWHVTIFELPQSARPSSIKLQVVDPLTGNTIDQPFSIDLNRQLNRRLGKLEQKGELDIFIMKGVLIPKLKMTSRSDTANAFHNPRLVGPFARFGFSIDVTTMIPIKKEKKDDAG